LSLAYHVAAAAAPGGRAHRGEAEPEIAALLRRTVEARRKLADTEEALGRLAAGRFGSCEQCGAAIPADLLAAMPETRYCPRCDAAPLQAGVLAGRTAR
jgi:DnaK suppressor protein